MPDELEMIEQVARSKGRFATEAYTFTVEALNITLLKRRKRGVTGHIAGQELLAGIKLVALDRFGYLGRTVFEAWGLRSTANFGDIVFDLVEAGVLSKQDSDSKDDFVGGFDFVEAFERSFIASQPSK